MEIVLRGVRGSIACPSQNTAFYGGNTACIELRTDNDTLLFFDAGTGLREAGESMPDSGECHIFLSHGHSDHILGLWFFKPLHSPNWTINLYLPDWLGHIPDYFYQGGLFPVPFSDLKGHVVLRGVLAGNIVRIDDGPGRMEVEPFAVNHPGRGLGYKVRADKGLFVYSGDHEITVHPEAHAEAARFLQGADIAVVDAMYGKSDYRPGWGHSTWEGWVDAAAAAGTRNLVLTHHDPARSDQELDDLDGILQTIKKNTDINVFVGREGMRLTPLGPTPFVRHGSDWLLVFLDELTMFREESAILDRILTKAREITSADAGTIFMREGDDLLFSYTHNDSLFSADKAYKFAYATARLPVSTNSIAGYVASTGRTLNLDDAYALPPGVPFGFNKAFDSSTGYRTRSILALPFWGEMGKVTGVLQLINCLNPRTGLPCPFTPIMAHNAHLLAREASATLERSALERHNVYGILRMAAVHDPAETGPHAERVGAIAAELYQCWGEKQGHMPDAIRYGKSRIRLAAMLHDIGKVGISDLILKKPGKLTDEEFAVMRSHTAIGSSVLSADPGDIAAFAHDISLHHHQKWNGRGYPEIDGNTPSGEDIPLSARITAIADVFDALVSPRCYKKPWSFEESLDLLRKEAGEHFDPDLVACMEEIKTMLRPIYDRFPEPPTGPA